MLATVGNANGALQVFAGAVSVGAAGKITTLTTLLLPQEPVPGVFAAVLPQADVNTYLATIEWHPTDVGIVGVVENVPPSMLYCTVNPGTVVTAGRVKAALQVFAGAAKTGAAG